MNRKKIFSSLGSIIGLSMILITFFFMQDIRFDRVSSIILGIGAGILGLSIGTFLGEILDEENPTRKVAMEIEINDERNINIREKAALKTNSIMTYFLSLAIIISTLIGASKSVLFIFIFLLISKIIIQYIYLNKYTELL